MKHPNKQLFWLFKPIAGWWHTDRMSRVKKKCVLTCLRRKDCAPARDRDVVLVFRRQAIALQVHPQLLVTAPVIETIAIRLGLSDWGRLD